MWKPLHVAEKTYLTLFTNKLGVFEYLLYDVYMDHVLVETITPNNVLSRAIYKNPGLKHIIDTKIMASILDENEPIFVDLIQKPSRNCDLKICLQYCLVSFTINFDWQLKVIDVPHYQRFVLEPCLKVIRSMYGEMEELRTALYKKEIELSHYVNKKSEEKQQPIYYTIKYSILEEKIKGLLKLDAYLSGRGCSMSNEHNNDNQKCVTDSEVSDKSNGCDNFKAINKQDIMTTDQCRVSSPKNPQLHRFEPHIRTSGADNLFSASKSAVKLLLNNAELLKCDEKRSWLSLKDIKAGIINNWSNGIDGDCLQFKHGECYRCR